MGISDRIETFISELLKDEQDWVEVGRNELASIFSCVPSQINYVIKTRFSADRGYLVESRRGGGGYLKIRRIEIPDEREYIFSNIGNSVDFDTAKSIINYFFERGSISQQVARTMLSAISENVLSLTGENKNKIRAMCLKNMLLVNI